jgi:hypothetical protein
MIITEFYRGQGFGNQLWLYAVVNSASRKLSCDFSIISYHRFKGKNFLNLDPGQRLISKSSNHPNPNRPTYIQNYITDENLTLQNYSNYIKVSSKIDGSFQMEELIQEDRDYYKTMFKVCQKINIDLANVCIINLRGGEYSGVPELLLPREYYVKAMELMKKHNPNFEFKIITDDPRLAKSYFPELEVLSKPPRSITAIQSRFPSSPKIQFDFSILQNAGGLILSNSSFSWWGAWTNCVATQIIAPKFWGNYNNPKLGWGPRGIFTSGWSFLDSTGKISVK